MYVRLPVLTPRLRLRLLEPDDSDDVFAYLSLPGSARYGYHEPPTAADWDEVWGRRLRRRQLVPGGDPMTIAAELRETGHVVGDLNLTHTSAEHRSGEIGWVLHPSAQGRGLAVEAGRELLRMAFEELGLHRVVARLDARNTASENVCRRLGMRREAHLVENEWVKGEWTSELVYALLARESTSPGLTSPDA